MNNLLSSQTVMNNIKKQHDLAVTLESYFAAISWENSVKDFPWHRSSRKWKVKECEVASQAVKVYGIHCAKCKFCSLITNIHFTALFKIFW